MKLAIAQLGDIHLKNADDPILARVSVLCRAIAAEVDSQTASIVLLLTGDFAQSGAVSEFELAADFVTRVSVKLKELTNLDPLILCIPGNHDLDLSVDQDARNTLVAMHKSNEVPATSTLQFILTAEENYFAFAKTIASAAPHTKADPFVTTHRLMVGSQHVTFRLLNSAWMSTRGEKTNSLYFPVNIIDGTPGQLDEYVISAVHHPINWFKQPETMRLLQTKLEGCSKASAHTGRCWRIG